MVDDGFDEFYIPHGSKTCKRCNGAGFIIAIDLCSLTIGILDDAKQIECTDCNGTGMIPDEPDYDNIRDERNE